jgi:uncharacterized membrane protein YccC
LRNRDVDHPWLQPLWVRALLVAFCAAWAVFEFASNSPGWGLMFGMLAAYGAWTYLIAFNPRPPET